MRTHTECPSDSFLAVCFRAANLQQTVIKMEQSMFYWAAIADSHAVAHYHWNTYNVKEHLAVPCSWEVVKPLQEQLLSEDTCGWLLRLSVLLREDSLNFKERVSLHSSSRGHCFLHWNLRGTCSKESRRVFEAWGYSPHFQICFSHFWIWRFLNPFQYFAQRERWYLLELNPCWEMDLSNPLKAAQCSGRNQRQLLSQWGQLADAKLSAAILCSNIYKYNQIYLYVHVQIYFFHDSCLFN